METSKQGRRAFNRDTVIQIRRAWRYGHSSAAIAKASGISERSARRIAKGETYRRVIDEAPDTPPLPLPKRKPTSEKRPVVMGPKVAPAQPADTPPVERTGRTMPQIPQDEKVVRRQRPLPRQLHWTLNSDTGGEKWRADLRGAPSAKQQEQRPYVRNTCGKRFLTLGNGGRYGNGICDP